MFLIFLEEQPSLFSQKTLYDLYHTKSGRDIRINTLPKKIQKSLTCDNLHLLGLMDFTEDNGFPIIKENNLEDFDFVLYPYSQRPNYDSNSSKKRGIHFFQYDYKQIGALTTNLERTTRILYNYDIVFGPDMSQFVDTPTPFINKQNIFRSRFATALWQHYGFNVVQTASWGDANSLKYAFEGLAKHSTTAVCGIGHDFCKSAQTLWNYSVSKLIHDLEPTSLIIYGGNKNNIQDFGIPTIFIEDYITKNFRNHD